MLTKIPQNLLRTYLQRQEPLARLNRYNFLGRFLWMKPILGEIKDELFPPVVEVTPVVEETATTGEPVAILYTNERLYIEYRSCPIRNPLNCSFPQQAVQEDAKATSCVKCGFPATLAQKTKLKGNRGTYTVETLLGRRGMGRLYQGTQLDDSQPVTIKEYLLPQKVFNKEELTQRKAAFISLAGLNLADGRMQDCRLICPWEAIADRTNIKEERCYLITKSKLDTYPTLSRYLARHGAMTSAQVQQVLKQVLQTLVFLHEQKFSLPSGQIKQKLAHGNLNLHSLLIDEESFFIYLCDLALWENLFHPPTTTTIKPVLADDLSALGQVAFQLLIGKAVDPASEAPIHPKDYQQWPPISPQLKEFILRLVGMGIGFESANAAHQALLKLPTEKEEPIHSLVVTEEKPQKVKVSRTPLIIFGTTVSLLLLGGLIWFLASKLSAQEATESEFLACCIKDVPPLPHGKFTYTGEAKGTWTYVLQQPNLIAKDKTLEAELQKRLRKSQLIYKPVKYKDNISATQNAVVQEVRAGKADFAITSLVDQQNDDLTYKEFAYDGLVVFVNFSYSRREKSLPNALKGKITFAQLRQLYTGQIKNWQELGGPDLRVKLYIPTETEALQIFEQRVLKDKSSIEAFRSLWQNSKKKANSNITTPATLITQLSTSAILRKVIEDFENNKVGGKAGGIGFGTISKVYGQCSVYPLAVAEQGEPVQSIVQNNGLPIDPSTDLCNNKGSYYPNEQLFSTKKYPLAYPITVVYARDNRRSTVGANFVNILKTKESQQLLSKTGLVPLQPLPEN
ncbi:putative serine/threonine kinase [Nostoc commune NIES-4072]|uniref:Putative serine/threonine kinase n=1 Tax=Nostoc commune NIES-4072 TaxID=2005467 RepID=A0A2R5FXJ8_NOSCO|nr:substrate-binding domain-containing protein [Nostoc commune]BBD70136.1 putative serine/threonine kinase [Nostoc commune HK-02]GBG22789.1 putative serine/threonine kinase [Nostoc commune NIES-4072]